MVHHKNSFKSADGIHDISYEVILPDGDAKGIVQISHGMCEYFGRYNDFGKYMASHGYIVCGNDHLGHGESVRNDDELGYFSPENGWKNVVSDLFTLTEIMKKTYPDLPYYLFGHSMGSFMARAYCVMHGEVLDVDDSRGVHCCASACAMNAFCSSCERLTNLLFQPQTRTWTSSYFSGSSCAFLRSSAFRMLN